MQGEHVWHQVRKLSPIFTIPVTVTDKWSNLVYSNIREYGQSTTNNTISLSKANEIQLFTSKRQKTITTALIQASVTTLKTVQPSTALNRLVSLFIQLLRDPLDSVLISTNFSCHHIPTSHHNAICLRELMIYIRPSSNNAGIWINVITKSATSDKRCPLRSLTSSSPNTVNVSIKKKQSQDPNQ